MKATEDYHKMQACEYYQHNECDCLTECSFETKPALLTPSLPSKGEQESQEEPRTIFWKETARLMDEYRKKGNEERVQGIVDCRILFNRLYL